MKVGFFLSIGEDCNSKPPELTMDNSLWTRKIPMPERNLMEMYMPDEYRKQRME